MITIENDDDEEPGKVEIIPSQKLTRTSRRTYLRKMRPGGNKGGKKDGKKRRKK